MKFSEMLKNSSQNTKSKKDPSLMGNLDEIFPKNKMPKANKEITIKGEPSVIEVSHKINAEAHGPNPTNIKESTQNESTHIIAKDTEEPQFESSLNLRPESKKSLNKSEKFSIINFEDNDLEFLSRDENRFLRYLSNKLQTNNLKEVRISREEFATRANVNSGRFHNTRKALVEKNRIIFREVLKDDPTKNEKKGIYYRLILN